MAAAIVSLALLISAAAVILSVEGFHVKNKLKHPVEVWIGGGKQKGHYWAEVQPMEGDKDENVDCGEVDKYCTKKGNPADLGPIVKVYVKYCHKKHDKITEVKVDFGGDIKIEKKDGNHVIEVYDSKAGKDPVLKETVKCEKPAGSGHKGAEQGTGEAGILGAPTMVAASTTGGDTRSSEQGKGATLGGDSKGKKDDDTPSTGKAEQKPEQKGKPEQSKA